MKAAASFKGRFILVCRDKDGKVKWRDTIENLVVHQGLQKILDDVFTGGTDTRVLTWYLGLTDGTPTLANADTLASHAGWVEVTAYTGDRKAWVEVRSAQTLTNAASVAQFAFTAGATVGGAFLCSAASGTAGTLMSVGALTGADRTVANGDNLDLTYEFVATSA